MADMTNPAIGDKMPVCSIQPFIKISSTKVPKVFSQKDPYYRPVQWITAFNIAEPPGQNKLPNIGFCVWQTYF